MLLVTKKLLINCWMISGITTETCWLTKMHPVNRWQQNSDLSFGNFSILKAVINS